MDVSLHMQSYLPGGRINFGSIMEIPSSSRITALAKINPAECMKTINSATLMFLQSSGVDTNMSFLITNSIFMESSEDNLSIEDVVIFLMKLNAGQYGKFFGAITPTSFMEKFEEYRQERHEFIMNYREEQQANHKSAGIRERSSDGQVDAQDEVMRAVYKHYGNMPDKQ